MKTFQKMLCALALVVLLVSGVVANPKAAEAQAPVEKLAVFESFGHPT
jgi:hypothetical protein